MACWQSPFGIGSSCVRSGSLALDLFVFHRHDRVPSLRESAGWTVFWCCLAVAFNGLVAWWGGSEAGLTFLTGYLIEWSLSMDNVFVFAVIFTFFQVPLQYQYRVLFWGILGAIVLRLAFVLAGVQLIHHFDWVLPLFGLLLVYTGVKLAIHADSDVEPEKNVVLRFARRLLRVASDDHRQHGGAFSFAKTDDSASPRCSWCCWSSKAPTCCSPSIASAILYTGVKLAIHADSEVEPEKNVVLRFAADSAGGRGRPSPARRRLLRPRKRAILHHSAVPRALGRRKHRPAVRRR